jgi:hypothetical protein
MLQGFGTGFLDGQGFLVLTGWDLELVMAVA